MLITALIAAVISIAAGVCIRAWAFAVFAFLVAIGFGGVVFVDGSSAVAAIGSAIAILVLMEIGYLTSVFLSGLLRRNARLRESHSVDNVSAASERQQG
ncbi:hypothetical protein B5K08_18620 [Rhizobium leguminosarum bv. trifolii]|uniref:Transmembrane protein n=1 Tax=Rhizobium leguminosarum bv. trifolii TaxID=386 RepID=A0A3E1BG04_RHILT|nr:MULTISPECIES: hypothetical protein [Rhizobium]ANM11968.1 hypothetical protein AMK05_CH03611 [Rhizobium sp. N324]ANM18460.1 hypothetical protein AMK06_CH03587 [Rhizobium sp. N541]ANM24846.1 hypothetical protein AMK07_CH03585 [Rhizobium sp. N941]OYD05573.1 hypothetical protein AMK08_CH103630 [Rhizobium sp. N4311]RFB89992.1 hypothetical protein B5K08_18620 [Rhizobium leguminosarum bv. trifolii]